MESWLKRRRKRDVSRCDNTFRLYLVESISTGDSPVEYLQVLVEVCFEPCRGSPGDTGDAV